ncbi:MAG: hypothetical protein H7039_11610 [Bryobacteraceae bacterium]|nr:hypothetical protein [Bryobacteraceae bacterium]
MRLPMLVVMISVYASAASLPASLDRYAGKWELQAAASDNIEGAIEKTIAPMNFVKRPIARGKLKRRNYAFPRMTIASGADGLLINQEKGLNVTYQMPNVAVRTKAPDGAQVLSTLSAGPGLILNHVTEEGKREDNYILSSDGAVLTMAVSLSSTHLPQPLTYKLVYGRSK